MKGAVTCEGLAKPNCLLLARLPSALYRIHPASTPPYGFLDLLTLISCIQSGTMEPLSHMPSRIVPLGTSCAVVQALVWSYASPPVLLIMDSIPLCGINQIIPIRSQDTSPAVIVCRGRSIHICKTDRFE